MLSKYIYTEKTETNLRWFPIFLILYNFVGNLSNDIYMPSMPHMVVVFGTSKSVIQLTMSVWFAGVAIPQLFFGPLADRFGRKLLLISGSIVFVLATLLCSLSTNIWLLLLGRFLQGVGVCSLNVVSFTALREVFDYHQSVRWFAYTNTVSSLAPLVGPVIGGYIFIFLNWQMNFILVLFLGLVSLIALWFLMPESLHEFDRNALLPKYFLRNYRMHLRNKYFLKHLLSYSLLLGGIIAYLTSSSFLIIKHFGVTPEHYGYTQLPVFGMYIIGSMLVSRAVKLFGSKAMIVAGLSMISLSTLFMLVVGLLKMDHLIIFIITMCGYTLGFSFASSPLTIEAMSVVHTAKGSAAALLGLGMSSAGMLGSMLIGLFYNNTMLSVAFVIFLLVLAAVSIFLVSSKK